MKRNALFVVVALALGTVGAVSVAQAQDTGSASADSGSSAGGTSLYDWFIAPRIGIAVPDKNRRVKADVYGGVSIGAWLSPHFTLELAGTMDNAKFKDGSGRGGKQWETLGLGLEGRYYFLSPSSRWRPYLMLGVGAYREAAVSGYDPWTRGETAGVGVLYNVNQRLALRGEIGGRWYKNAGSTAERAGLVGSPFAKRIHAPENWRDGLATVSLMVRLGNPAPPPAPVAPPPPPAPVAPPPPPPQNVVIDLRGVNFKFDRPKKGEHNIGPTLKPPASDSLAILNQAVDTLNRYPQVTIEIDGYTDSVGKAAYNQGLSERRANIVDAYLTSHGIDPSRITSVKGFGASDPVDTNKTAAGRQRNRRVEFKVQQPQGGSM